MKKTIALLFIGSTLTIAACQPKPKTEEMSTSDSAMTTTMGTDSTKTMGDSASSMMSTTTTTESTTK